ncbi:unnamed protein product [Mytilus edulis]|uniref:SNTX thioredoxin-like domain-containing protein n=1 Tax=Mytilus edulis TaxID=6550 RepID=A0A8S3RLU1_MYTED|nr:unnamed protein product [Mytilus edulis]
MLPWLDKIANMKQWISQNAEIEVNLLSIYIKELKKNKIEILQKLAIDAKLFEHDNVVILDIVLPFSNGQYCRKEPDSSSPENRPDYETEEESHDSLSASSKASKARKWYEDAEIKADIRKRIKRFVTLNSTENRRFEFFVTLTDCKDFEPQYNIQPGALATLYEDGREGNDHINFDLLSSKAETRLCRQTED